MKKGFLISAALVAAVSFVSCNKENSVTAPERVRVSVSTELPIDANTKVAIDEDGSNFALNWEGTETFGLANTAPGNATKTDWVVDSYTGTTAVLSGTLVATGDATSTTWMLSTNLFSSTTDAIRANVPANQSYNGSNVATNCLLVARADDASVSAVPSMSFKTMNSFLKFSLTKGSAAGGSSTDYTKMYVQNIIVEAIGGENLAGRFEISKTEADWMDAYSGTVDGQMSSTVTLDCTAKNAKGEELSAVAKDFYVAIAFGSYASGLRVTINVQNQDGDAGTYVRTIGTSAGISIARNNLVAFPELTVNPTDDAAPVTYTLIEDPSKVAAGTYFLAGKFTNGNYYLWTGAITTTSNKDMITAEYTYNTTTHVLTGSGAVEVTLEATEGGFYVKYDGKYLRVTDKKNRRLALDATSDVWAFDVSYNDKSVARGGLKMTEATFGQTLVSATTPSNVLRNYGIATNGNYGVYLFKQN